MIGKKTRSFRLAAILSASAALTAIASHTGAPAAPPTDATAFVQNVLATSPTQPGPAGALGLADHDARALSVDDTGHLHLLKAFGSVLLEEGAPAERCPELRKSASLSARR